MHEVNLLIPGSPLRGVCEVSSGTTQAIFLKRRLWHRELEGYIVLVPDIKQIQRSQRTEYNKLTTIDDLIAKYTSTPEGKTLWNEANDELKQELYAEVVAGKLNKVKYYRLINNMDQITLAKLTGIKQPNISRIEQRGYEADSSTYKKIAKVFRIDYRELLP